VKQWLIDNADRFNLRDKNQKEAFFEELAKICNWNDVGGRNNQTPPLVSDDENNKKEVLNKKTAINQKLYTKINTIIPSPLDDEMPF
ncbi:MAG TPA: hypothetical protein PKL36_13005, partial [Agitococcus sp.]|nr:hypothetical protein [Agitococcus sp.]